MMTKLAALVFVVATGCVSSTDGDLAVSGRVADSRVTHVIAVNTADGSREIVSKRWDDSFEVTMKPGSQYVLVFADVTKAGRDMVVGTLQSGELDALSPQVGGALDLGTVSFKGDRAHGTASFGDIADALGVDESTALTMGMRDDLALRFANIDVDGNGSIDIHPPTLNVAGTYSLSLSLEDVVAGKFEGARVNYQSTTLSATVPSRMNMNMATGTMMFEQPFYGSSFGSQTPMIAPYTQIGQPEIKIGQLGADRMIGVAARAGHDIPRGTYEIDFANGSLTYTHVYPPSAAVLESAQSYSVPFLHIKASDAKCRYNCAVDGLELAWKTLTPTGWKPTAEKPAHVDIVLRRNGKDAYVTADLTTWTQAVAWQDLDVSAAGIADYELAYYGTQSICYVAVSYESELGMRMTNQLTNPACF